MGASLSFSSRFDMLILMCTKEFAGNSFDKLQKKHFKVLCEIHRVFMNVFISVNRDS